MSHLLNKGALHSCCVTAVTAVALSVGWAAAYAASPEDEIARLNRVRQNLFEELVKTRAEAASARAELEAAIKTRDQAEAELARLKQEAASAKSAAEAPDLQANIEPHKRAADDVSATPRSRSVDSASQTDARRETRPPGRRPITVQVPRTAASGSQPCIVQTATPKRTAAKQVKLAPRRPATSTTRAQELPNLLRLQNSQ
jgi:hypothetical protein